MAKNKAWINRHVNDTYVKLAHAHGYRSRAAFKLQEIAKQDHLFRKGMVVVDLGAAPGSFCQVAREGVGPEGVIIALDLLPIQPLPAVTFIQGDFLLDETLAHLYACIGERQQVDVVLSDMSPNLTGIATTDRARAQALWEATLAFSQKVLKKNGILLSKVFHCQEEQLFRRHLTTYFKEVLVRKPGASRSESSEHYLLAKGFRG